MATIDITYSIQQISTHCVRLSLTASNPVGTETQEEIFAVEILPLTANPADATVRFSHVCDLADMNDFPTVRNNDYAYYRVGAVQLVLRNRLQADHVLKDLLAAVKSLMQQYTVYENTSSTAESTTITIAG